MENLALGSTSETSGVYGLYVSVGDDDVKGGNRYGAYFDGAVGIGTAGGGAYLIRESFRNRADTKMHIEALQELAESFENGIAPQVIALDDKVITLSGSVDEQYEQWKEILNELNNIGLNSQLHTSSKKLSKNTDIYIVDTYGESAKFYSLSKLTFLGGSLIPHGGQNPLEPAREGNYILYGPHVENFKEVYEMLEKLKITRRVNSIKNMKSVVRQKINFLERDTANRKLKYLGDKILNKNLYEIKKFI